MHHLGSVVGRPVRDGQNEPIGKVDDLIVAVGDRYPPVTGLVAGAAGRRIFLPWTSVGSLDETGVMLHTRTIDIGVFERRRNEILLRKDLLDRSAGCRGSAQRSQARDPVSPSGRMGHDPGLRSGRWARLLPEQ